jgi:hypothetical protein
MKSLHDLQKTNSKREIHDSSKNKISLLTHKILGLESLKNSCFEVPLNRLKVNLVLGVRPSPAELLL